MPFVGIGVGIGRQRFASGGGGGFDADYQAVLDYATTQGYTLPSSGQQALQNQLVLDLKDGGIWSKLDTFGVFATDGDSDFALIDWIRLTDYTAINSPTFTTNQGFQGNGTSSYIDTSFNPNTLVGSNNYKLNNASVFSWVFTNNGGFSQGTVTITMRQVLSTGVGQRINSGNNGFNVDFTGTGLKAGNKTASNTMSFFNNLTNTSGTGGGDINTNSNILILRASSSYSTSLISIVGDGASLNAENTDLYNALNTYITSI